MTPPGPRAPRGGVREAALRALMAVDGGGERADHQLERWLPAFPSSHRDRALLTQLVQGTLRRRGYLDWLLDHFVRRGVASLDPPARNALRLALFQIECLDRIPSRAAVFESVELARSLGNEGSARLVNGVLREIGRKGASVPRPDFASDPVQAIAVLESHPRWMVERWVRRYGPEEARALAAAGNRVPRLTLRVNRLRTTRDALAAALAEQGLHPSPGELYPDALRLRENVLLPALDVFRAGHFTVQDEASCLVPPLLGVREGETVVDLCAGPGGKTAHLAELAGPAGRVLACDVSPRAIARVRENAVRLGLGNVVAARADGRELAAPAADRVLVDAPCSGLGVLARRADARWRRQEGDIARFAALQSELLDAAADLARPGGSVLYATCTIEPEENEEVVRAVLARRGDLELVPLEARGANGAGLAGGDGMMRLLPHRHGCDGGFAALLRRREGAA